MRVSYQEDEIELRLPFGSHSRLFLSEVNRAWSGRSDLIHLQSMWCVDMAIDLYLFVTFSEFSIALFSKQRRKHICVK